MSIEIYQINGDSKELISELAYAESIIKIARMPKTESAISTDPTVRMVYLSNQSISSNHCQIVIQRDEERAEVTDNSRNGTIIKDNDGNDLQINKEEKELVFDAQHPIVLRLKTKDTTYEVSISALPEVEPAAGATDEEEVKGRRDKASGEKKKEPGKKQREEKGKAADAEEEANAVAPKKAKKQAKDDEKPSKKGTETKKATKKKEDFIDSSLNEPEAESMDSKNDVEDISNEESSNESVVKNMVVSDSSDSEGAKGKRGKGAKSKDSFDYEADYQRHNCNIELDFDPLKYLKEELDDDEATEAAPDNETISEEVASFQKTYPTIVVPREQIKYNFDFAREIRHFDLFEATVWASGLNNRQLSILENFQSRIDESYDPRNVKYYIVNEIRKSNRFLIALATGIPIVDASCLELEENVKKSQDLRYSKLFCKLMQPTAKEIGELIGDSELVGQIYRNYNLAFVTAYCQVKRLLVRQKYLFIGDFTQKSPIQDEDDLNFLVSFGYFINQLGARAILLLDKEKDKLFDRELLKEREFKQGIIRAMVGDSLQDRFTNILEELPTDVSHEQIGIVACQAKLGFDGAGTLLVDKDDLIKSSFLGTIVQTEER